MTFSMREKSIIRHALREQAKRYRKMARSRKFAGEQNADARIRARTEAAAYDILADQVMDRL